MYTYDHMLPFAGDSSPSWVPPRDLRARGAQLSGHWSLKIMLFLDMGMGQNLSDSIKYHIFWDKHPDIGDKIQCFWMFLGRHIHECQLFWWDQKNGVVRISMFPNDELACFLLVDGHVRGIPHFEIHPTLCHLVEGTIAGNTRTYEKNNIVSCSIHQEPIGELRIDQICGPLDSLDLKDGQKGLTWYVKPIIFCPSLDERVTWGKTAWCGLLTHIHMENQMLLRFSLKGATFYRDTTALIQSKEFISQGLQQPGSFKSCEVDVFILLVTVSSVMFFCWLFNYFLQARVFWTLSGWSFVFMIFSSFIFVTKMYLYN